MRNLSENVVNVVEIVLAVTAVAILVCGWVCYYVVPRGEMMEATAQCVEAREDDPRDPKTVWRQCWEQEAAKKRWLWSDAPMPKQQAGK